MLFLLYNALNFLFQIVFLSSFIVDLINDKFFEFGSYSGYGGNVTLIFSLEVLPIWSIMRRFRLFLQVARGSIFLKLPNFILALIGFCTSGDDFGVLA